MRATATRAARATATAAVGGRCLQGDGVPCFFNTAAAGRGFTLVWRGSGGVCARAQRQHSHTQQAVSGSAFRCTRRGNMHHPATSRPTGVVGSALVPSPSLPVASPAAFACARIALFTAAAREPIKECRQCASTQPALSLRHCGCSAQNRARPRAPMAKQLIRVRMGPGSWPAQC